MKREKGVTEILKPWIGFLEPRPVLMSLLYDIDMLPEQCTTVIGAIRYSAFLSVWEAGEKGLLAPPAQKEPPHDPERS